MRSKQGRAILRKFLIVGCFAFAVNYLMLEALIAVFKLGKTSSEIIAMAFSINLTFYLHDSWTYLRERSGYRASTKTRYISYLITNSSGSILTIILFSIFSRSLPNLPALALAALISMCWNFVMNLIIWKQKETTI